MSPASDRSVDDAGLVAILIDEGYHRYGVTADLASVIAEGVFYSLDGRALRMGAMHIPIPFPHPLKT
jgi:pyruvate/2-oxoglutarate/acetoin dehydrogenase E1 component